MARSHSASSNNQAFTMNTTTPAYPNHIDTPSTTVHLSSSDTIILKDAAPPIGSAANGSSLWHSILDTYGKEILKCASHEFLDLATALRLETINVKDLDSLLAKVGRLGHRDINIIEHNIVDSMIQQVDEGTQPSRSGHSASTLPSTKTGQGGSDSTAAPRPSPVEASRGPK
jgi:hypothetical protein